MKRINPISAILIMGIILAASTQSIAQRGIEQRGAMKNMPQRSLLYMQNIPDLTEEQESQITDLRTKHMKEMLSDRNTLNEKRAKLRTLQTADKVEMNKINQLIEEMGAIHIRMHKARAQHRQDIRNLLTDEQRVYFDRHFSHRDQQGFHRKRRSSHYPGKGFPRERNR